MSSAAACNAGEAGRRPERPEAELARSMLVSSASAARMDSVAWIMSWKAADARVHIATLHSFIRSVMFIRAIIQLEIFQHETDGKIEPGDRCPNMRNSGSKSSKVYREKTRLSIGSR